MQVFEFLLEVVGICLGQKGHFWSFFQLVSIRFSSKAEGSFSPASRMRFGFCQPVIPDISSTTAQLAQALRLLGGRFESEFVGFQNLHLSLSVQHYCHIY